MKKIWIAFIILASLLILVGAYFCYAGKKMTVVIGGHQFSAELALTAKEQQKGLGNRAGLCQNCAMLFKFGREGDYAFWMKDMRFDLDIIWISHGKIVYIAKNLSHMALNTTDPKIPADQVLEINAGLANRYGFKIGDAVRVQ